MLTKLLKHEFRATGRVFQPMLAILIGVSLVTKLFVSIPINNIFTSIIGTLLEIACYVMIVAAIVICIFICVKRFKNNLTGDEGYLMFTLPVTASQHIAVKLITSIVWSIASAVAAVAAALLLNYHNGLLGEIGTFISDFMTTINQVLPQPAWLFIIIFILILIVDIIFNYLMFFSAVAIGHLSNSHRTLISVLAYFALYAVVQIINSTVLVITGNTNFINVTETAYVSDSASLGMSSMISSVSNYFVYLVSILGIIYLVGAVLLYILTSTLLSKKLNLE